MRWLKACRSLKCEDQPHLSEDGTESDLRNGRRVGEAEFPATLSHPEYSEPALRGRNSGLKTVDGTGTKILNSIVHWHGVCAVYHLKPTGHVMHHQFNIQQLYVLPTLYLLCFVFIWEQTATCATYSINLLVFITEIKSVHCVVQTGALNKAVCTLSLNG